MMELSIFFQAVNEHLFQEESPQSSFHKSIRIYQDKFPDYKSADVAIIGLGNTDSEEVENATAIRSKLYRLSKGSGTYNIVDLGNISPTVSAEQYEGRIREVCAACIENNTLPLLIGGAHHYTLAQYLAYEDMEKLISLINVDAFLDMGDPSTGKENSHIQQLLMHQPNYLFNYSHLAYQSYLVNQQAIAILEKLHFEAHRIGALRHDIKEMEPVIRQADMLSFDLQAVKACDFSATNNPQPFGLSGEEACQLCWYAGINEKLSSAGFFNYQHEYDDQFKTSAAVVATMIWYFIEGFYHRSESRDFKSNDYTKYVVSMPSEPENLTFFKSNISEKWWLQVPSPSDTKQFNRNSVIPCSYTDYQQACSGELPERWIVMHSKLF